MRLRIPPEAAIIKGSIGHLASCNSWADRKSLKFTEIPPRSSIRDVSFWQKSVRTERIRQHFDAGLPDVHENRGGAMEAGVPRSLHASGNDPSIARRSGAPIRGRSVHESWADCHFRQSPFPAARNDNGGGAASAGFQDRCGGCACVGRKRQQRRRSTDRVARRQVAGKSR
jgi:hypothetical protein